MTALIVARAGMLRNSLQTLLGSVPHIGAVEATNDSAAALRWIARNRPTLIVLELHLMGDDVWSTLRQIQTLSPGSRRIVLADDVQQQAEIERPAAEAVLLKGTAPVELIAVVERLLATSSAD